jgi:hypothetical protein
VKFILALQFISFNPNTPKGSGRLSEDNKDRISQNSGVAKRALAVERREERECGHTHGLRLARG